jgi:hypothetical protein
MCCSVGLTTQNGLKSLKFVISSFGFTAVTAIQ